MCSLEPDGGTRHRQLDEDGPQFVPSDGAAVDSAKTRHRVPVGERSRAEQPVVSGPEQVAADPEEIVHDAVDGSQSFGLGDPRKTIGCPSPSVSCSL